MRQSICNIYPINHLSNGIKYLETWVEYVLKLALNSQASKTLTGIFGVESFSMLPDNFYGSQIIHPRSAGYLKIFFKYRH